MSEVFALQTRGLVIWRDLAHGTGSLPAGCRAGLAARRRRGRRRRSVGVVVRYRRLCA